MTVITKKFKVLEKLFSNQNVLYTSGKGDIKVHGAFLRKMYKRK